MILKEEKEAGNYVVGLSKAKSHLNAFARTFRKSSEGKEVGDPIV